MEIANINKYCNRYKKTYGASDFVNVNNYFSRKIFILEYIKNVKKVDISLLNTEQLNELITEAVNEIYQLLLSTENNMQGINENIKKGITNYVRYMIYLLTGHYVINDDNPFKKVNLNTTVISELTKDINNSTFEQRIYNSKKLKEVFYKEDNKTFIGKDYLIPAIIRTYFNLNEQFIDNSDLASISYLYYLYSEDHTYNEETNKPIYDSKTIMAKDIIYLQSINNKIDIFYNDEINKTINIFAELNKLDYIKHIIIEIVTELQSKYSNYTNTLDILIEEAEKLKLDNISPILKDIKNPKLDNDNEIQPCS